MELRACLETNDYWLDGKLLLLAARETEVLHQLVVHRGRTTPRDRLAAIWDETATENDAHCVQTSINRLRRILGRDAILTRPGIGYVLQIPTLLVSAGPVSDHAGPAGISNTEPDRD